MIIKLTKIFKDFTEEAQEKYDKFQFEVESSLGSNKEPKKDELGRTAEDYESLGIEPPEELKQTITEDSFIEFSLEEDYITKETEYLVNMKFVEDLSKTDEGTLITLFTKRSVLVKEELKEIYKLIKQNGKILTDRF